MKLTSSRAIWCLTVGFIAISILPVFAQNLMVSDPWVRHAPPTVKSHAGYFIVKNNDTVSRILTSAKSPLYERVEIHTSKLANGIATMQRVEQIDIEPDKMVIFEPGGFHLMLIGPKKKHVLGAPIPIELVFQNGDGVKFQAFVKKSSNTGKMHNHHNMKMN